MCGIAGILMHDGIPEAQAMNSLSASLAHRGPDGSGRFDHKKITVIHKRLSIIDLETGGQPIHDQDGSVIVANGEIYNFLELREALGEEYFKTKSDSEPALRLYALNGVTFTEGLRGMYAIAIVNTQRNVIQLARDPFGIKPLYYTKLKDGVAFSSEAGALLDAKLTPRKINRRKRLELMQLQYTTGADTIFENITRVMPGQTLTLANNLIKNEHQYNSLPKNGPKSWSETEALQKLNSALMDSVMVHQRSDVPYGMFLSGGVDSSAILACMRDLNETPVEAFTAGFSETSVNDEREHAKLVADAAGANFNSVEFSENDFWTLLPEIAAALDDPVADYAILPTYKLGKCCKEAGIKVVLSGEGGDELFAGYGRYRRQLRPWILGGRRMYSKGIFRDQDLLLDKSDDWRGHLDTVWKKESDVQRTKLQIMQAVDCAEWLAHDLLIKLDRCLMSHGVEGRTPFLDLAVANVAMSLPDNLKIRRNCGKYLLRKWLEEKLPEADAFSGKKGFTVPVSEWMGRRGVALGKLVASKGSIKEICNSPNVERLFASLDGAAAKRNGKIAWVILFYALWHRRHIEGLMPEGDIFDVLSA